MTISDPVGDMFARIRNAQQRNHKHVMVPSSKFKKFVFNSTFLERYDFSKEAIEEIKNDDIKLLQFGFEWLKVSFFQTGQEKFKIKEKK